jgi:hypothetical protein
MINAAIYGTGRWGQNLTKSVQGKSDKIKFTENNGNPPLAIPQTRRLIS